MEGSLKINQENIIEKNKIEILKENLKEIFDQSKYSTFGHGTGKEQVESILKNGLESANNCLDEVARCLDDTEESYDKILNWIHRNSKYIVIIMIPNPTSGMGGYSYLDNAFEMLPENKKQDLHVGREFKKEYFIQPQFIKGYIDVNSLSFIKNKLYDPEAKLIIKEIPYGGPRRHLTGEPLQMLEISEDETNELLKSQKSDDDWF